VRRSTACACMCPSKKCQRARPALLARNRAESVSRSRLSDVDVDVGVDTAIPIDAVGTMRWWSTVSSIAVAPLSRSAIASSSWASPTSGTTTTNSPRAVSGTVTDSPFVRRWSSVAGLWCHPVDTVGAAESPRHARPLRSDRRPPARRTATAGRPRPRPSTWRARPASRRAAAPRRLRRRRRPRRSPARPKRSGAGRRA